MESFGAGYDSAIDAQKAFESRLATIHGLHHDPLGEEKPGGFAMDLRRAEMLAMIESFLGLDYDRAKVIRLLELQDLLHERQTQIYDAYESRRIPPRQYVDLFNDFLRQDFLACERLLGPEDFNRLFGCELNEAQGFIDIDAFLASEAERIGSPLS